MSPMAPHTWMGIGGPAAFFVEPRSVEELQSVVQRAAAEGLPIRLLGGGSNLRARSRRAGGRVATFGAGLQSNSNVRRMWPLRVAGLDWGT